MRICVREMGALISAPFLFSPVPTLAQSLPTTENGFYMMRTNADDLSEYRSVDSMCIGESHNDLMAFNNIGDGTVDFIELREGEKVVPTKLKLSEPDAGVSQIRYRLIEPASNETVFELDFVNPGALGDPAKIPMVTLSSVHIPQLKFTHLQCLMGKHILYAGIDQGHRVTVMADEEGTLIFQQSSIKENWVARNITGGFWSSGKRGEIIFTFIEGSAVTSIKAAPHQRIEYPAWRTANPDGRQYSASPKGFFVADMAKLGSKSNRLPYGLVLHFERLEICRHLAGETSGNPDRDKQVANSWQKAGCDEAKTQHPEYVRQFAGNKAISEILKTRGADFQDHGHDQQ
ncbi:hypothetical protein MNBD_ALPHA04-519 [hydrothermal vent metagenome]|uniref:Uncharacterized protein n=1 Tax=hydrothermal vent metagenome TaxID=652676 RepID=A0A3B0SDV8_9ZZZZ